MIFRKKQLIGRAVMGRRVNTITNTTLASPTYNGNGSTTGFATGFQFIANADLLVTVTDSSGVETVKTLNTDYTVSGAGSPSGGTVTFLSAPASGSKINIESNVTIDQQTDYQEGGSFAANTHEAALDKLTKITQQLKAQIERSLTLPISNQSVETTTGVITPNYLLRVNGDGDGLEWASVVDASLASSLTPTDGGFVVGDGTDFVVETGATARSSLGLGTIATQAASGVSITGGSITGITDLAVADGGTGASTASDARTNLGLGTLATQSGTFSGTSSGTNTGDQNLFSTISVSGQSDVVADTTSDTLTLVAGSNVTITTDAATDTITIAASGGGGGGSPGGSTTQVQYNSAGSFAGAAGFTFDGTGTVYLANGLELGHASDTTITRSSAGNLAVEGNVLYRAGGTDVVVSDGGTGLSSATAYAVLCGGTTSTGALQSIAGVGTSGQVLTSNGAGALPTFQTATGGAWTMISTATASSSATVDFTGLSSSYSLYAIVFDEVVNATEAVTMYIRTSTNNGSSYDSGASDYLYCYHGLSNTTYASGGSTGSTFIQMGHNAAGYALDNPTARAAGIIYIARPSSAATCSIYGTLMHRYDTSGAGVARWDFAGVRNTAADVDAVRILMSSGNITSGNFKLFGIN